jgi:outer membrane protein TolC
MRSWWLAGTLVLGLGYAGGALSQPMPVISLREQMDGIILEVNALDLSFDNLSETQNIAPYQIDIVREDLASPPRSVSRVVTENLSNSSQTKTSTKSTTTNETVPVKKEQAQTDNNSADLTKENKEGVIALTLQEAIARGEAESQELKIALKELERSRLSLAEVKLNFFPTVDLSVGFNRTLSAEEDISVQNSRRLGLQNLTFAQQRAGELTNQLSFLQSQPPPDQFTDPVAFIQREQQIQALREAIDSAQREQSQALNSINNSASPTTNLRADFNLSYNLFSFGRRERDIKAAEIQVDIADLAVKIIRNNLRLSITNAYYDLQDAKEQIRIEEAALKEAGRTKLDATALKEAGLGTRFDELSAAVQQGNVLQRLVRAQAQVQVAASRLAELINLPPNLTLDAKDPPDRTIAPWSKDLNETLEIALKNRVELLQQMEQMRFLNEQRARILTDLSPNINLSASVSTVFANSDNGSDSALRGLGAGYALGVNLNWNLIDWGRVKTRVAQIDKSKEVSQLRLEQLQNQIQREVREAYALLQANAKNVESARFVVNQAENALRLARLRFQAGVGTQVDTIVSESQLTQAQVNLSRATLDYNRAYVALERATGFSISP